MKPTLGSFTLVLLALSARTYAASILWPADLGLTGPYPGEYYDYTLGGSSESGGGYGLWIDITSISAAAVTLQVVNSTVGNPHAWFPVAF